MLKGVHYTQASLTYLLGRYFARVYSKNKVKRKIIRHGRFPHGPVIFACNHPTSFDPVHVVAMMPRPVHMLITEWAFQTFPVKQYLQAGLHIKVGDTIRKEPLEKAIQYLKDGRSILIFPEGATSHENGTLKKFYTGALRMAITTGTPIVPIGIYANPQHIKRERIFFEDHIEELSTYKYDWYVATFGSPITIKGDVDDWFFVREQTDALAFQIEGLRQEGQDWYFQNEAKAARDKHWGKHTSWIRYALNTRYSQIMSIFLLIRKFW